MTPQDFKSVERPTISSIRIGSHTYWFTTSDDAEKCAALIAAALFAGTILGAE